MIIACPYRIYPAWRGFDGDDARAIEEIAQATATRMGWRVAGVNITSHGFDHRGGHYRDFTVIYHESVTQRSTQ